MAASHRKRQKTKGKPQKPSIKIPSSPKGALESMYAAPLQDKYSSTQGPPSSPVSRLPFQILPTSPSTPFPNVRLMQSLVQEHALANAPISAKDIASNEILAIAGVFATMKTALVSMANAFDRLGNQSEKLMEITLDMKATEQIRLIRASLEDQIERQKAEIETLRNSLQTKIREAVEIKIREEMYGMIKSTVRQVVEERVKQQLAIQIPEDLRQQVVLHKRQILQVKASLHNSEARRYNALQTLPGPNARLRPLLRPLPTPEQSPTLMISRTSSIGDSIAPKSAFPQVPASTPIKRSTSNTLGSVISDTVPPTPSQIFPRDLSALFSLSQDDARRLLREYGLDSATSSPMRDNARPKALPSVDEEFINSEEEDSGAHADDLNRFMAHIGVPFLMIPAPKEKKGDSAPLSAKSRRKRLLTPLIIK